MRVCVCGTWVHACSVASILTQLVQFLSQSVLYVNQGVYAIWCCSHGSSGRGDWHKARADHLPAPAQRLPSAPRDLLSPGPLPPSHSTLLQRAVHPHHPLPPPPSPRLLLRLRAAGGVRLASAVCIRGGDSCLLQQAGEFLG